MSDFNVSVAKPEKLGPETHSWFWHPNRVGARKAPAHFMKLVNELQIEPAIHITWNPIREIWQVWQECPRIQHPICQGFKLLFNVMYADGSYMPLDERVMWKLWDRNLSRNPANGGSGIKYWERINAEMEREKAIKEKDAYWDRRARTDPAYDFSQIKVGYGKSNGSKFSTYMR